MEPRRPCEVTGIGPKHAERIVAGWQAQIEADDESVVADKQRAANERWAKLSVMKQILQSSVIGWQQNGQNGCSLCAPLLPS
jgi:Holliday junction resolvasome RuvABC DNA-binding subunit